MIDRCHRWKRQPLHRCRDRMHRTDSPVPPHFSHSLPLNFLAHHSTFSRPASSLLARPVPCSPSSRAPPPRLTSRAACTELPRSPFYLLPSRFLTSRTACTMFTKLSRTSASPLVFSPQSGFTHSFAGSIEMSIRRIVCSISSTLGIRGE